MPDPSQMTDFARLADEIDQASSAIDIRPRASGKRVNFSQEVVFNG